MKILSHSLAGARDACRGAALLMAFLVLIVIIAIVYQINTVTLTDERITYNDITRAQMDLAIESVLLQTYEDLAEDARAAQASEGEGAAAGGAGVDPGAPTDPGEPARNPDTVDSRMDRWYTPQSTSFGDIQLRIFVRDEDSKYNVLNMLQEDEELADLAVQRVTRILDYARGGTSEDITSGDAEEMALAMQAYMLERMGTDLPRPTLLTTDPENDERIVPFTFSEFRALEVFEDGMFEDFFGPDEERIHAITSFLTVYTSPAVGAEEEASGLPVGDGGWGVNVNTAPFAVLTGLFDSREFPLSMWEGIRDYRNEQEDPLEEESEEGVEDVEPEPMLDEFGEEIFPTRIFDSLDELEEIYDFEALNETEKSRITESLEVTSDVFEIVIAARISTAADVSQRLEFESRREQEEYFRSGEHLVRVVRSVVWRRPVNEDVVIVPLVRWEVLDNAPLQVLDFPDED